MFLNCITKEAQWIFSPPSEECFFQAGLGQKLQEKEEARYNIVTQ